MQISNYKVLKNQNGQKKPKKPCKKCSTKRYSTLVLCYRHYLEKCRLKRQEKLKRLERKVKSKKFQKSEWKKLHKKCWELQKQYLRKKHSDFQGYVECYTGGELIPATESQQGHFHHGKLDFDLRNIHLQCAGDNLYKSGNLTNYSARLVQENGQEWFLQLNKDASRHTGYTIDELKEMIEKYQTLVNQL